MSQIVLIDGENFLYSLRTIMGQDGQMAPRELFLSFSFRSFIAEVIGGNGPIEIFYYGARLREYNQTPELLIKTKQAIKFQLKLANALKKNDITLVKAGYLRAREGEVCPGCGHAEWKLLEKGVDVGLAVRLITEAKPGVDIILVSSDTDLLPAVQTARANGANVTYVGFEHQPILSLIKAASLQRVVTMATIKKYLELA